MADEKKRSENRELNENEVDKVSGGKAKLFDGIFCPDVLDDLPGGLDDPSDFFPETDDHLDSFRPDPMSPYQP